MIRLVIVDDHPVVRRGLRETLAAERDFSVVAEAGLPHEALAQLDAHICDVVLLDLSLPGRGGLDLLSQILRRHAHVRVLIVSTHEESTHAVRAIRAGAAGYVAKTSAPEDLVKAVRAVVRHGLYLTPSVAAALARHAQGGAGPPLEQLSNREHEVLRLLAAGRSISEIGDQLALSVKTISTYRSRIAQKLGVRTTADLVRYAWEHKLFE